MKCNSHRARDKALSIIGHRRGLWSLQRNTGKGVYPVTDAEFSQVQNIKGISGFRPGPDLMGCWEMT